MILLTLECGLGKPLCEFLGCEVLPWEFPRANTGDEFLHNMEVRKKQMGKIVMWNMVKTLVPTTTVGIAWGSMAVDEIPVMLSNAEFDTKRPCSVEMLPRAWRPEHKLLVRTSFVMSTVCYTSTCVYSRA